MKLRFAGKYYPMVFLHKVICIFLSIFRNNSFLLKSKLTTGAAIIILLASVSCKTQKKTKPQKGCYFMMIENEKGIDTADRNSSGTSTTSLKNP